MGARPKDTASKPPSTPPIYGNRPLTKEDIEKEDAILKFYKQQREIEKMNKEFQLQEQKQRQKQQQSAASPHLRPQQPRVPQPAQPAPPPLARPQPVRPQAAKPPTSPVSYPAPAVRAPSQLMPVPAPFARFRINSTPVPNQTTRPHSRQSQSSSRPASTTGTQQGQYHFFKREVPASAPMEETFDEEIRRPDHDFPDNQRWASHVITPEEQEKIRNLEYIKAHTEQALADIYKQKTATAPTQQLYCGPDGDCQTWYGPTSTQQGPSTYTQQPKMDYYQGQDSGQGNRVHFSSSVDERDYLREQRERETSSGLGFSRHRGNEGFRQYSPDPKRAPILAGIGHVMEDFMDPHQKIRIRKKPETDPVLTSLINSGMSEDSIVAYCLSRNAQKESKRDRGNDYEIQTISASHQNLNPNAFDYNIRGSSQGDSYPMFLDVELNPKSKNGEYVFEVREWGVI
jgi:hypothetical protein